MRHLQNRLSNEDNKVTFFNATDIVQDFSCLNLSIEDSFESPKEYCKLFTARIDGIQSVVKFLDIPQGVTGQLDILSYLSILKSFNNNHLEQLFRVGFIKSNEMEPYAKAVVNF